MKSNTTTPMPQLKDIANHATTLKLIQSFQADIAATEGLMAYLEAMPQQHIAEHAFNGFTGRAGGDIYFLYQTSHNQAPRAFSACKKALTLWYWNQLDKLFKITSVVSDKHHTLLSLITVNASASEAEYKDFTTENIKALCDYAIQHISKDRIHNIIAEFGFVLNFKTFKNGNLEITLDYRSAQELARERSENYIHKISGSGLYGFNAVLKMLIASTQEESDAHPLVRMEPKDYIFNEHGIAFSMVKTANYSHKEVVKLSKEYADAFLSATQLNLAAA